MTEFTSDYVPCRDLLLKRLREPAPGRIQLLTGPRQVGKTTLLLEIAAQFGDDESIARGRGLLAISWNQFLVYGPP